MSTGRHHQAPSDEAADDPTPEVSVVIPARDAEQTIVDQLRAVSNQAMEGRAEIIVVDNGSSDRTAELAVGFPGVRVVEEPRRGPNRARNAGVAAARGDVILFADADDVVGDTWLSSLSEASSVADYFGGPIEYSRLNDELTLARWNAPTEPRFVGGQGPFASPIGCNCGFRRSVWETLGGFDERLQVANDEYEFFWRAGYRGYRFVTVADAIVHYRLRAQPGQILQREYRAGRADVVAYRISRDLGMSRDSWFRAARVYGWLLREGVTGARDTRRRWQAMRVASRRLGRLTESLHSRVLYL